VHTGDVVTGNTDSRSEPAPAASNAAGALIGWATTLSLAYAAVRYHVLGPVDWKDFPFFILNKALALDAFILLTLNFGLGPVNNLTGRVPPGG